jgi:hypothetical protein
MRRCEARTARVRRRAPRHRTTNLLCYNPQFAATHVSWPCAASRTSVGP